VFAVMAKKKIPAIRTGPSSDDAHHIAYFTRHADDDSDEATPGRDFLRNVCPAKVRMKMLAVLTAVASAPPKR
jgi:hypothetical protein